MVQLYIAFVYSEIVFVVRGLLCVGYCARLLCVRVVIRLVMTKEHQQAV